jgi:myo-inositol-1(or 4)-monophosphatase
MSVMSQKRALVDMTREAGEILRGYYGRIRNIRLKENQSSVVCEADLAAEKSYVDQIRARYPRDNIIAEESGHTRGTSEYTWVIDPLDGTSNFVAGLPWFGTQVGLLRGTTPVLAAIYLPIEDAMYVAEAGKGLFRNGKRVAITTETKPTNILCAFGFDPNTGYRQSRHDTELLRRVASGVRNIRATNSVVDFCYTMDGRLGGCVNLNAKIWDIVPVALMIPEAGGRITDLFGDRLRFDLSAPQKSYTIVGSSRALHGKLLALLGTRTTTKRKALERAPKFS